MMRYVIAILSVFAIAPNLQAKTYDCHVRPPTSLNRDASGTRLAPISFPQLKSEPWAFSITIEKAKGDDPDTAHVVWAGNPIQIAGDFPLLPTGDGAFVFNAVAFQGCMFTAGACMSLVQIADKPDRTAQISIQPAAIDTDREHHLSTPFIVVIDGTCTWKDT